MTFKEEADFLNRVEKPQDPLNERKKLTNKEAAELLTAYPAAPVDFINYLQEIGSGNFRQCQFKVQARLFDLESLGLSEHYEIRQGIKFFGDNFSGDFAGFDLTRSDDRVVEFWREDGTIYETNKSFRQYIREQMLMDENGNDLSIEK